MFRFKQFSVDQSGCAMKINTDGVLLGATVTADEPETILDIGTGTGVIALMLAQKVENAKIYAVEIDETAAQTAERNFNNSPFAERLAIYATGFENYFTQFPERKYDLIVSNPPFYIDALKSPKGKKTLAKHTDFDFFEKLIAQVSHHLTANGFFWMIVPVNLEEIVLEIAKRNKMSVSKITKVHSYQNSAAHRAIICLGFSQVSVQISNFIIYADPDVYSGEYKKLLQPYFLAF